MGGGNFGFNSTASQDLKKKKRPQMKIMESIGMNLLCILILTSSLLVRNAHFCFWTLGINLLETISGN